MDVRPHGAYALPAARRCSRSAINSSIIPVSSVSGGRLSAPRALSPRGRAALGHPRHVGSAARLDRPHEEAQMPYFPLELGRCALLVNDFEQKMVEPGSPYYAATVVEAVERLLPLLAFCRAQGVPTVFALIGPQDTRAKGARRVELAPDAVE